MQRETRHTFVVIIITVAAVVVILWPHIWESTLGRRYSEQEVERVVAALDIGSPPQTVEQVIKAGGYQRLELRKIDEATWTLETPSTFGATNWVVWLEFVDRHLARVSVSTMDSRNIHPAHAPPDKDLGNSLPKKVGTR